MMSYSCRATSSTFPYFIRYFFALASAYSSGPPFVWPLLPSVTFAHSHIQYTTSQFEPPFPPASDRNRKSQMHSSQRYTPGRLAPHHETGLGECQGEGCASVTWAVSRMEFIQCEGVGKQMRIPEGRWKPLAFDSM